MHMYAHMAISDATENYPVSRRETCVRSTCMNIPGHAHAPSLAWATQNAPRPPMSRVQEQAPYLHIHNVLGKSYPLPLLRLIEMAILDREGVYINGDFFASMEGKLTDRLQSIPANCSMEDFWTCIGTLRSHVSRLLLQQGQGTVNLIRNRPHWLQAETADWPDDPRRHFTPLPLQQLALDRIAQGMDGTPVLADRIAWHQTTLSLILFHVHISEFTMAARQFRPDLWQLSGPLECQTSLHIEVAKSLIRHAQGDLASAPEHWRRIFNMLSMAGMRADDTGMDMDMPEERLTSSQMLTILAMEDAQHHIATIFNGREVSAPLEWSRPLWPAGAMNSHYATNR